MGDGRDGKAGWAEPYALGRNKCLAEIYYFMSGVYETLQDNTSNQEPFE